MEVSGGESPMRPTRIALMYLGLAAVTVGGLLLQWYSFLLLFAPFPPESMKDTTCGPVTVWDKWLALTWECQAVAMVVALVLGWTRLLWRGALARHPFGKRVVNALLCLAGAAWLGFCAVCAKHIVALG
jgi:hypothetical protein